MAGPWLRDVDIPELTRAVRDHLHAVPSRVWLRQGERRQFDQARLPLQEDRQSGRFHGVMAADLQAQLPMVTAVVVDSEEG